MGGMLLCGGIIVYVVGAMTWLTFFFDRFDPWVRSRLSHVFHVQIRRVWCIWRPERSTEFRRNLLLGTVQIALWIPGILLPAFALRMVLN
jgi:hypothetical protein